MLHAAGADEAAALAFDDQGRVLGVVGADDARAEHLLGGLDVRT
jgi:hypothetical protein